MSAPTDAKALADLFHMLLGNVVEALTDQAEGFTCSEAEAMYEALRLAGLADAAEVFMASHALGDEDTDDHEPTDDDGWRRRSADESDPE